MQRIEFTIEPFVEAYPGAHVTAPVEALQSMDVAVEVGPFGSACDVDDDLVDQAVAAITRAAIANGATHLNLDINRLDAGAEQP